ncbi:MAG: phospholipase D-like domain-containing protein, partial [Gammaproteobacteria bacterium]|nr:phospholipase D-like domain-containing protein [Gammaproteobacteria bacterium]
LHLKKHKLLLFRDHRKMLVVDGNTAFIGGAGITDKFSNKENPEKSWRENMLEIRGDNVDQWQILFNENWKRWSDITIPLRTPEPCTATHKGRVAMTEGPGFLEIKRSAINRIRKARGRVWLCTAYFVPSRKFRQALRSSAKRGVDVRILIPGSQTDHPMTHYLAQHYYTNLLSDGVRIFEYQPRFLHAKIILCDNWVSLGSCNIDRWNLRWNLDANQEIQDPYFSTSVMHVFQSDFKQSIEINDTCWKQRSFSNKLKIGFWNIYIRLADIILTRLKIIRHWKRFRNRRG